MENTKIKDQICDSDYLTEQFKAAYALNMCTVSVSQIVDYNDIYILEQEYEAILNNLNLERMPKDEALHNILVELLNTITFFRIEDIKKQQIEKKYQERTKNAIWSAVPNLGMIVAGGNPVTMAISLASQVGIGYMNYRREKAKILSDKEKEEVELRITAIEQFNALRRELFTTAWRLAAAYNFPDEYRLTEKQIKQYNEILLDSDDLRMYERLEAIQDKFKAYPPFWYYFGHAANAISINKNLKLNNEARIKYRNMAKQHFDVFEQMSKFNILREDQMTSAYALEYVDILLAENTKLADKKEKIKGLLELAIEMAGNANDTLELCAIAYLKIGEMDKAANLLRILVNEDYNRVTNGKILSRIYVSQYLQKPSDAIKGDYDVLELRVNRNYLFPMPQITTKNNDKELQSQFLRTQKNILRAEYGDVINSFIKKYMVIFNKILPAAVSINGQYEEYYGYSLEASLKRAEDAKNVLSRTQSNEYDEYVEKLYGCGIGKQAIDILNQMVTDLNILRIFQEYDKRDKLLFLIRTRILVSAKTLQDLQDRLGKRTFAKEDFDKLEKMVNFETYASEFMDRLKEHIFSCVDQADNLSDIDNMEFDLVQFCRKHNIEIPVIGGNLLDGNENNVSEVALFDYSLLGDSLETENKKAKAMEEMLDIIKKNESNICTNSKSTKLHLKGTNAFEAYFENERMKNRMVRYETVAILDDQTWEGYDLLFTVKGLTVVESNRVCSTTRYENIKYFADKNKAKIKMDAPYDYENKNIDISVLYSLIKKIADVTY